MRSREDRLEAEQLADANETLVAIRDELAKQAPPQVTVTVPERAVNVQVPENIPPNMHFNFPAPLPTEVRFQVPEQAPPVVNVRSPDIIVEPPIPRAYNCRITERDENGFILAFTITPA